MDDAVGELDSLMSSGRIEGEVGTRFARVEGSGGVKHTWRETPQGWCRVGSMGCLIVDPDGSVRWVADGGSVEAPRDLHKVTTGEAPAGVQTTTDATHEATTSSRAADKDLVSIEGEDIPSQEARE